MTNGERKVIYPRGARYIQIVDWVMLIILVLALIGILVPTLITPPYPIVGGRLIGGITGVSITAGFAILTVLALIAAYRGTMAGKIYHTVFSIISLFIFPIGTILQGIALYFMYADPATVEFFRK